MANHAKGTFVVKLTPQAPAAGVEETAIGRMVINKQFLGDLEASSHGQMLSVMGEVAGSAGYVAIERVTGSLNGHIGSFALQHTGTMDRGTPQLSVTVVPDSGSGDLAGISGKMTIEIDAGKHSYGFEYTINKGA